MGFNSAVAISQLMHRRRGFGSLLSGAVVLACWEGRRIAKLPLDPFSQHKSWNQYYLGDIDTPCIVLDGIVAEMLGKVNGSQLRQRASYRASGVLWAEHKAITQETHAIRKGR